MDLKEAMVKRHVVKHFIGNVSSDEQAKIKERVNELNKKSDLQIKLIVDSNDGINNFAKLFLGKHATNYLVLGSNSEAKNESLGYASADLMLYLQTLGLNSWFVGGTFNKKALKKKYNLLVPGIIVFGHGKDNGKPHKSKTVAEVSDYNNTQPLWYQEGVKAALLAPTALNKQQFHINFNDGNPVLTIKSGSFSDIEAGLIRYHFELASGHKLSVKN